MLWLAGALHFSVNIKLVTLLQLTWDPGFFSQRKFPLVMKNLVQISNTVLDHYLLLILFFSS